MVLISVIVPVRDDPRIDDLLASLALQAAAPDFEVLVAMDGSRREPLVPPGLPARLLRLPPRGPYPARNTAVAEAAGEVLLFTDSDCLCPPNWISVAGRFFEDEAVAVLQGASRAADDTRLSRFIQREYERYVASHAALGYRRFCNTRNFAIRTAIAREIRLPETLPRGGDGVYGRLLEERGVPIRYEAGWWVAHRHPESRLQEGRRAFSEGDDGARWARLAGLDLFAAEEHHCGFCRRTGRISPAPSSPKPFPSQSGQRLAPSRRGDSRGGQRNSPRRAGRTVFFSVSQGLPSLWPPLGRVAEESMTRVLKVKSARKFVLSS